MELCLRHAIIQIIAGDTKIAIWADARRPAIYLEAESKQPTKLSATLEMWRTEQRAIKTQTGDLFRDLSGKDPFPTIVSTDIAVENRDGRIVWCHHNELRENDGFEINLRLQGLEAMQQTMRHPLLGRTFGAALLGGPKELTKTKELTVRRKEALAHTPFIVATTTQSTSVDGWKLALDNDIARAAAWPWRIVD